MMDENNSWKKYSSASRDIAIYNQNEDKFVRISLAAALRNCGRFGPDGTLIAPRENPYGDVAAHAADLEMDFLTFHNAAVGTQRESVQFLGDISYEFLGDALLGNAGRTVFNAIKSRLSETQFVSFIASLKRANQFIITPPAGEDLAAFNAIANSLIDVLGKDNMFLRDATVEAQPDPNFNETPGKRLWEVLVARNRVPVYLARKPLQEETDPRLQPRRGVNAQVGSPSGGPSGGTSRFDTAFLGTLRAALPESQRTAIQSIIDSSAPVMERAEQIRNAVFDMVDAKVPASGYV